jgi:hypothetical protein
MTISAYFLMFILLMAIVGYFVINHWWLFCWLLLMIILLMVINGYCIINYCWIFYVIMK